MIINYCVNLINQVAGLKEVDVTCLLDNETWTPDIEANNSTHSTWNSADTGDMSESCGAAMLVPKGRTIKLHGRDTGDNPPGMSANAGSWRVHAVKAVFIPLEMN